MKKTIICDSCLKEKEPYYDSSNLCEECAIKMDNYIEGIEE